MSKDPVSKDPWIRMWTAIVVATIMNVTLWGWDPPDWGTIGAAISEWSADPSPTGSPTTPSASQPACKALDVEQVAYFNAEVKHHRNFGGDKPQWFGSGSFDSSFARCVDRLWTFSNCAGWTAGDMSACEDVVKKECCP